MGQCCSCAAHDGLAVQRAPHQQDSKGSGAQQGTRKLNVAVASADTPVAVRASSVSSLTPSGSEKRHRAVAASPTRFFELLAEPSAKLRTELLQKASMEYQASGDLGPLQPDTPQNSVRSLLNALLLKQAPNQDSVLLQDMCGDAWIQKSSLTSWRGLGEGAFATVQHCTLKQENGQAVQVAVKKLKPHVLSNAVDLREFLSEANTLRRLKHRHIVEFKGVGCMEPQTPESMATSLYIVQEYMSGSTLKVHVLHHMFPHNSGPVESMYTWLDALRWLEQIAAALKYLHSLRPMVVHRDLKLENMLLTGLDPATADAKLADFGLCKLVKDTAGAVPFVPGTPVGSPLHQGFSAATALGNAPGTASRATDGRAVGSTPMQQQRGDDSAKAGPSQGGSTMTALGVSSSHAASEIDSGGHVSTAVHPTVANSIASSTHSTAQTSDAAAASGPASRLGQDQGQLEHAPGHAGNSPDDAAGVRGVEQMNSGWNTVSSAADSGRQGFAPQQGFVQDQSEALRPESVQSAFFATSNAAGSGAAAGAFPGHQAGNSPDVRLDHSQAKTSDAGSVQSTSCVVLSANGASSSAQLAEAPLQHDSQRQMPTEPDQAISAGAVLTQAQRQPQMAPPGGEAEQRKVEEHEVLYNMTGQTGSLMYMAPEVMKGQSYNEKVDVFSFAVIIFELLSGRVAMAAIGDQRDLDYEAVHAHAEETANGFRLPLPVNWPAAVLSLINDCWAQRSSKRPSFATIERRLQEIKASGIIEQYLVANPKHVPDASASTGCVIS
ncbi:TPA: hypothetical protein ACH3X3_014146 [Trebouxia sp. C0006]